MIQIPSNPLTPNLRKYLPISQKFFNIKGFIHALDGQEINKFISINFGEIFIFFDVVALKLNKEYFYLWK